MIISASRRTDIPAFYSEWFMKRLREGYCCVRNPFNPSQIFKVNLNRESVTAFVFWTRNPQPLFKYLGELDERGYTYYFHFTITPYSPPLENLNFSKDLALDVFRRLSHRVGPHRVIWRYDPIIISNVTDISFHKKRFEKICKNLSSFTKRVMISFVTPYKKTVRNLNELKEKGILIDWDFPRKEEAFSLLSFFYECGAYYGIEVKSCAEKRDWSMTGVKPGACVDPYLIKELGGNPVFKKDPGQRRQCLCAVSKDIGATNTCLNACPYCYSTMNRRVAFQRYSSHSPDLPFLA